MIAPDHDRRRDLAGSHQLVEAQAEPRPLPVSRPADPRRQALVGDPLLGQLDPAPQRLVVGDLLEHRPVGGLDVRRVAGESDPAERALAVAEQRADVGGDEAGVGEGPLEPAQLRLGAQAVAVVEDLGAGVEEADHRGAVGGDRGAGAADVLVGVLLPQPQRLLQRHQVRHVAVQRVVGAGLVGDDVGLEAHALELRQRVGRVGDEPDAERAALAFRRPAAGDRVLRGRPPPRPGSRSRSAAPGGSGRPRGRARRRRSS